MKALKYLIALSLVSQLAIAKSDYKELKRTFVKTFGGVKKYQLLVIIKYS